MPKRSKYRAVKCELDGHKFDSKAERDRYVVLKLLEKAGEISDLTLQPEFELQPKAPGLRAINYRADFAYCQEGKRIAEDVKGFETAAWLLKKKMFRFRYPELSLRIVKQSGKKWIVKEA